MPTNEERREVAERLRGDPYDTIIPYRTGIHFGMGCHEAANRFWDICERIKSAGDYDIAYSTRYILADLIEPEKFNKWMEDHEFHEKTCHAVKFEDDEFGEECTYTCSECGELLVKFDFEKKPYKPIGYCPGCGAEVVQDERNN